MLARVARNIYWMARYVERAENTARLINVNSNLLLDLPKNTQFGWQPLLAIMGNYEAFIEKYKEATERNVIRFLVLDDSNSSSLLSSLSTARENLRTTRDIVPTEVWEHLNDLYLYVKSNTSLALSKNKRYDFLRRIIQGTKLITGIVAGIMSRDVGYRFLQMGLYLERADMTSRILDVRSTNLLPKQNSGEVILTPFDTIQWMSVLKSLTAYQMYRQHVRTRVQGTDVIRFLLNNQQFPRSCMFCVNNVKLCLDELPEGNHISEALNSVCQQLETIDLQRLATDSQLLHQFIDDLQINLSKVHVLINNVYFSGADETSSAVH